MRLNKKYKLIEIDYPEFGQCEMPEASSLQEFEQRIQKLRTKMEEHKLTHLIVYADREHFANLTYLTNFDPRFEEAIMIINLNDTPLLLVGNENVGRLTVSPLYNSGKLRYELYQPLSLLDQPRQSSRLLKEILSEELNIQNSKFNITELAVLAGSTSPTLSILILNSLLTYLLTLLILYAVWQDLIM